MDYKKLSKKKLIELYENLVFENKKVVECYEEALNDCKKLYQENESLKERNIKLEMDMGRKLNDFFNNKNEEIVGYLTKRIEQTQGEKKKDYKEKLVKYIDI